MGQILEGFLGKTGVMKGLRPALRTVGWQSLSAPFRACRPSEVVGLRLRLRVR